MADLNDPVLDYLMRHNIPVTRDSYINASWGEKPKPWTAEHEAELPPQFQDWEQFGSASNKEGLEN